ncbi:MAG: GTPase Era [bacterium]
MLGRELEHTGFVAIIGTPNSGKSTFLNTLIQSKISIVTPKAQTTRNKIRGVFTKEDTQIIFTDTPGITSTDFGKLLNSWMNKYSFSAAYESDITLFFVDVSVQHPEKGVGIEEKHILDNLKVKTPVILVANKTDIVKKMRVDDTIAVYKKYYNFSDSASISALNGEGIEDLIGIIKKHCDKGVQLFPEDMPTDQEDSFMVSEIIREKVFMELSQELPYHTVVTIERIADHKTKDILLVDATIHVARKSQKSIVIGSKGATLGSIGKKAREELEKIYGCQVGLKLFVRVEEKWFEKERLLQKVGFEKDFKK